MNWGYYMSETSKRKRVLNLIGASVCAFVLSQPALAAGPGKVTPLLRLSQQETPAQLPSGSNGPHYLLRTCQVASVANPPGSACYDPYQMRTAYQVDPLLAAGYDGTGHTIVIIDAFQNPNLVEQVAFYNNYYGLPATNLTQIAPDGLTPFVVGDSNMTGWAEEISLDVEWAHAIAPGAKIVLVLAKSNQDTDIQSALEYAVGHNLGDVISMSFGENESCVDPDLMARQHDAFAAATQQGITLFASSADQGALLNSCDGNSWAKAVSSPASDPLVTGVGGTELHAAGFCLASLGCNPAANPAPGTYQSEIVWNEGPPFGDFEPFFGATEATGGGFSVIFDTPPYQKSTVKGKQRGVPDVSYNAAILHGVLAYLDIPGVPTGFYRFGGTSAGAPQWSAITAIANQKAGGRLGFLNSALYQIGRVNKASAASLHDVTDGTNSSGEFDADDNPVIAIGFAAAGGWDPTTGNGSPIASSLVDNLIKYVSPGDGVAAIATTKPKPHQKPIVPGHMAPH
jgi:subtilase family serine protease